MRKPSHVIAVCGTMTALGVVMMLLGHVLGLGLYLAPMAVGLCLVPLGNRFGRKYHILMWCAISLLSAFLGVGAEQTLLFLTLFGLYPILYPFFRKLPKFWRTAAKFLYCNIAAVSVEALVLTVIAPAAIETPLLLVLLVLGNVLFVCYDFVIPHTELLMKNLQKRIKRR